MSTSRTEPAALAAKVHVTDAFLRVVLVEGREIAVPIQWFPRLQKATQKQRGSWRLLGGGLGIHWNEIDEDVSVPALMKC